MTKGKILVVDDTPANLEVIGKILGEAGYMVATAIDARRATKLISSYQPDLILLDVMMPEIDGFEVCQRLKADPASAKIPIIFITALADVDNKVKGFALGGVDYITKPFQVQEMLARVDTHLRLSQLTQSLDAQVAERTQQLEDSLAKLHSFQLQLVQSEKMSALGNLVAGVAHEINNPVGCILGNVSATQDYINDLLGLLDLYAQQFPAPGSEIENQLKAVDLRYVREDLPQLMRAMEDSGDRIQAISKSLRIFSRADTEIKRPFNLHEGLDSTMLVLRHRFKANEQRPEIKVLTEYRELPEVACFPGQMNQVFMNILANAIDALDEVSQQRSLVELNENPNRIIVRTELDNQQVKISISDNGPGISEAVKARIFDHLFTTKTVGKGTGLGLAIARKIIVETHGGHLDVSSEVGQGTEFCLTLPLT